MPLCLCSLIFTPKVLDREREEIARQGSPGATTWQGPPGAPWPCCQVPRCLQCLHPRPRRCQNTWRSSCFHRVSIALNLKGTLPSSSSSSSYIDIRANLVRFDASEVTKDNHGWIFDYSSHEYHSRHRPFSIAINFLSLQSMCFPCHKSYLFSDVTFTNHCNSARKQPNKIAMVTHFDDVVKPSKTIFGSTIQDNIIDLFWVLWFGFLFVGWVEQRDGDLDLIPLWSSCFPLWW